MPRELPSGEEFARNLSDSDIADNNFVLLEAPDGFENFQSDSFLPLLLLFKRSFSGQFQETKDGLRIDLDGENYMRIEQSGNSFYTRLFAEQYVAYGIELQNYRLRFIQSIPNPDKIPDIVPSIRSFLEGLLKKKMNFIYVDVNKPTEEVRTLFTRSKDH